MLIPCNYRAYNSQPRRRPFSRLFGWGGTSPFSSSIAECGVLEVGRSIRNNIIVTALPSTRCTLRVTTCWHSRRLRLLRLCICVVLPVFALCQASACTAWPFIFGGSGLADGDDFIAPGSAPVLAAVGAFIAVASAMRIVAGVVHSHFASGLGTRVSTRKDLSSPAAQIPCREKKIGTHLIAALALQDFFRIGRLEIGLEL